MQRVTVGLRRFHSRSLPAMAKLYYTPGSCGASNFIAAYTAGLTNLETETVDLKTKKTASGANFLAVNPKGNVPALVLDDGTVLNENAASLQYIADQKPDSGLGAGPYGSPLRYQLQAVLSFISSEFHGNISPLFNPAITPEIEEFVRTRVATKLDYIENHLLAGSKKFLVANRFTVADSYLYIVLSWAPYLKLDLKPYPNVRAYFEHIKGLPNVQKAHAAMATNPPRIPAAK